MTDEPKIRAYTGAPLYTPEGHAVGTLCVADSKPHEFGDADVRALQDLAHIVDDIIRIRSFTLAYDQHRLQKKPKRVSNGDLPLFD